jgi:hypothetical protein
VTSRAGLGLVAVLLGDLLAAGCYAVPPLRIGAGGGGAVGTVATRDYDGTRRENGVAGTGQLRLGVAPLAYQAARRFDIALGWELDSAAGSEGDTTRHGPYLEGNWFLRGAGPAASQGWRFGPTVTLEAHLPRDNQADVGGRPDDGTFGLGGSVGVLLEAIEPVSGRFPAGRAAGELGVGIGARLGVRRVDEGAYGYGIVSMEFRLPAAFGSVF